MLYLTLRQLFSFILSLLLLSVFTFGLGQLFPNGLSFILEQKNNLDPMSNHSLSFFNQAVNVLSDYYNYVSHLLSGRFGVSTARGTAVFEEFFIYFPATLELLLVALFFAVGSGLPLGILAAQRKQKWQDKLIVTASMFGSSIPIFWWAMLLVLLFSLLLGITPVASRIGFEYDIQPVTGFMLIDTLLSKQNYAGQAFHSAWHHLVLPAIVLGTIPLTAIVRTTRSSMINTLSQDYIQGAKSRGISPTKITWKYALRNALIPITTTLNLQISVLIAGSLLVETIFSWPGAGKWLLDAVNRGDFPVIHGGILTIASFVILTHLFFDLLSMAADPERRHL